MIRLNLLVLVSLVINGLLPQPTKAADGTSPNLTADNLKSWKSHILPSKAELVWTQIPWLPDLQAGIEAAAHTDKPLLLWTMNGHPLGCT